MFLPGQGDQLLVPGPGSCHQGLGPLGLRDGVLQPVQHQQGGHHCVWELLADYKRLGERQRLVSERTPKVVVVGRGTIGNVLSVFGSVCYIDATILILINTDTNTVQILG